MSCKNKKNKKNCNNKNAELLVQTVKKEAASPENIQNNRKDI